MKPKWDVDVELDADVECLGGRHYSLKNSKKESSLLRKCIDIHSFLLKVKSTHFIPILDGKGVILTYLT